MSDTGPTQPPVVLEIPEDVTPEQAWELAGAMMERMGIDDDGPDTDPAT